MQLVRVRRGTLLAIACTSFFIALLQWNFHTDDVQISSESVCREDMEVNVLPPMPEEDRQMLINLFAYITTPNSRTCRKIAQFGGSPILRVDHVPMLDGHKYVCVDRETEMITTDRCLIYSAGISDDWSFDWDMEAFGCTVFAFDPTINVTTGHQNGSIMFFHYGMDQWDHESEQGWQMRTLDTFVERLGHINNTIHYLKLDIEDSEWQVLKQQVNKAQDSVLFKNVRQLGVELHFLNHMPFESNAQFYREVYGTFEKLQQLGFYMFYYDPNLTGITLYEVPGLRMRLPSAVEVVWIKTSCPATQYYVTATGGLQPVHALS